MAEGSTIAIKNLLDIKSKLHNIINDVSMLMVSITPNITRYSDGKNFKF